jgi:predicted nucleic acid-binding protein
LRRAIIDTNVLIFAHFKDTKYHEEARRILSSLEEWVIPFIVFVELFWFTRGAGLDEKSRKNLLLSLLMNRRVKVSNNEPEDLMESAMLEDPLEFEDELILQQAEREGLPIVTFDNSLAERAKKRGISVITYSSK